MAQSQSNSAEDPRLKGLLEIIRLARRQHPDANTGHALNPSQRRGAAAPLHALVNDLDTMRRRFEATLTDPKGVSPEIEEQALRAYEAVSVAQRSVFMLLDEAKRALERVTDA